MNLNDEQSRYLVSLQPGTGAVFTDGMDHPILTAVPHARPTAQRPCFTGTQQRIHAVAALIAAGAGGCSSACHTDPCSLRHIARAYRLIATDNRIALWAELAVLAHLIGLPAPRPTPVSLHAFHRIERRLLDCAIRHAVDEAVERRASALASSHSPDDLVAHVANELRAQRDGIDVCHARSEQVVAPVFRWNPVLFALNARLAGDPHADRHPDSDRWEAHYEQEIPGADCAEQRSFLRRWAAELRQDSAAFNATVLGAGSPTNIEKIVGHERGAAQFGPALTTAMAGFVVLQNWPRALFALRKDRPHE